jgi:glucosyl-3-phosphoglycerate phosphatase
VHVQVSGWSIAATPHIAGAFDRGRVTYVARRCTLIRLVLWRHGQTEWNVQTRFQGQTDIPLDKTGMAQALRTAGLLASLRPDVIVSSHLKRAAATAAELAGLVNVPVAYDKDLQERYGGSWEGLSFDEIRARYPAEFARWEPPDGETPDGETDEKVASRVGTALERVAGQLDESGLAVVVSHGGAIRLGIGQLLGMTAEQWGAISLLANSSWSILGLGRGRWRLLEHNARTVLAEGRSSA